MSMKNRINAGILALLVGGIGVHKFYLGEASKGVLYLLFSWTFIPALLALIEGIQFLTMSDEEFDVKYNGANPGVGANTQASALKQYKELLDSGAITQEEYDAKKAQILG